MTSMISQMYTRVEFTADFGFGRRLAAFVECAPRTISFGVPRIFKIYDGTPENPSSDAVVDVFERTTIHADGRVDSHWPIPIPIFEAFDMDTPPLAQWNRPWFKRFELRWDPEYLEYMRCYYPNPKPPNQSSCLSIEVDFDSAVVSSIVWVGVIKPLSDVSTLTAEFPAGGHLWILERGWPWVFLWMSNTLHPGTDELTTAGRDYR